MAQCDPNSLAANSACFDSIPDGQRPAVLAWLLCQLNNQLANQTVAPITGAFFITPNDPSVFGLPSNVTFTANTVYFNAMVITNPITVSNATFFCNASAGGQLIDIGIYSSAKNLLIDTGPFTPTNAAWQAQNLTASITLQVGLYYFAFTGNSAATQIYMSAAGASSGKTQTTPYLTGTCGASAGGQLPATMGVFTGTVITFPFLTFK